MVINKKCINNEDEVEVVQVRLFYIFNPMAKKKQVERKLNNPEAYERINYLLYLCTSSLMITYNNLMTTRMKKYLTPATVKKEMKEVIELTQGYVKTLREVAKKSVIRL